jgi:hypothetical protein
MWADINIDSDTVKKAVVFIYSADANGDVAKDKPAGTGFMIFTPIKGSAPTGKVMGRLSFP